MISAFGIDHGDISKAVSRKKESAFTSGLAMSGGAALGLGGQQAHTSYKIGREGKQALDAAHKIKSQKDIETAQKIIRSGKNLKANAVGTAVAGGALGLGALANHKYVNQSHRQWRRE